MLPRSALNPEGRDERESDAVAQARAAEALQWLDPLLESPHFRKLWEIIGKDVADLAEAALDIKNSPEQRNNFAQAHSVLRYWHQYPTKQQATHVRQLQSGEQRAQAKAAQPPPSP